MSINMDKEEKFFQEGKEKGIDRIVDKLNSLKGNRFMDDVTKKSLIDDINMLFDLHNKGVEYIGLKRFFETLED